MIEACTVKAHLARDFDSKHGAQEPQTAAGWVGKTRVITVHSIDRVLYQCTSLDGR